LLGGFYFVFDDHGLLGREEVGSPEFAVEEDQIKTLISVFSSTVQRQTI
jgi:hypothetical protein